MTPLPPACASDTAVPARSSPDPALRHTLPPPRACVRRDAANQPLLPAADSTRSTPRERQNHPAIVSRLPDPVPSPPPPRNSTQSPAKATSSATPHTVPQSAASPSQPLAAPPHARLQWRPALRRNSPGHCATPTSLTPVLLGFLPGPTGCGPALPWG